MKAIPNKLIDTSSPYLLQHAYNPVHWLPWGTEALTLAKKNNMPILLSIGYSTCHWCHVMEKESFEDTNIADIMNKHFICIKVDREERPDIDQIYMDAIQVMGLRGGWPLHVFLTPEQKPFYGGTYFPPQHWKDLLKQITQAFQNHREKLEHSAENFAQHLQKDVEEFYSIKTKQTTPIKKQDFIHIYQHFAKYFDKKYGGLLGVPKFPMPCQWMFVLQYYLIEQDTSALEQLHLTLHKLLEGGIYNQIGGGFARYSVDEKWFVPHFEKMLYDNAQLISIFSLAYRATQKQAYEDIVRESILFVTKELQHAHGAFFSALDADSEGEEGKFYVWQYTEVQEILKENANIFCEFYGITKEGNWEEGKNIPFKNKTDDEIIHAYQLDLVSWRNRLADCKQKMLLHRNKRIRPHLDDKSIVSWNSLMIKACIDAYITFNEKKYLALALESARFIQNNCQQQDQLWHSFRGSRSDIKGFLDDYALTIQAYIALYETTFDENWVKQAHQLLQYTLHAFYDTNSSFLYYTDSQDTPLLARKKELFDQVIPSSNAIMMHNLFKLGHIFQNENYLTLASEMQQKILPLIQKEPRYLSYWASLMPLSFLPTIEIAIIGPEATQFYQKIAQTTAQANIIYCGTLSMSKLPLLHDRYAIKNNTTIYLCYNKTCFEPFFNVEDVTKKLKEICHD